MTKAKIIIIEKKTLELLNAIADINEEEITDCKGIKKTLEQFYGNVKNMKSYWQYVNEGNK